MALVVRIRGCHPGRGHIDIENQNDDIGLYSSFHFDSGFNRFTEGEKTESNFEIN